MSGKYQTFLSVTVRYKTFPQRKIKREESKQNLGSNSLCVKFNHLAGLILAQWCLDSMTHFISVPGYLAQCCSGHRSCRSCAATFHLRLPSVMLFFLLLLYKRKSNDNNR